MSETFQNLHNDDNRENANVMRPADSKNHLEPLGPGDTEFARTALERGYAWRGVPLSPVEQQQLAEEADTYLAEMDERVRPRIKAREFRKIYEKFDVTLPNALEVAAISANRRRARRRLHREGKI